jgi:hypothetical protein
MRTTITQSLTALAVATAMLSGPGDPPVTGERAMLNRSSAPVSAGPFLSEAGTIDPIRALLGRTTGPGEIGSEPVRTASSPGVIRAETALLGHTGGR